MSKKRKRLEAQLLQGFVKSSKKHGHKPIMGQSNKNKIFIEGKLNFQFGDLRVDTPSKHVVVEVETAGGVTNLVKYWYYLKIHPKGRLSNPIMLLHLFNTNSGNDYGSHLLVWSFLYEHMQEDLKGRFSAKMFKVGFVNQMTQARKYFEMIISSE